DRPDTLISVRLRDEFDASLGLKVPVPVFSDFSALLEFRLATDAARPFFDSETTAAEGQLGVRKVWGSWAVTLAGGPGMASGVGTPVFRTVLLLDWQPQDDDVDGDGIPDDRDGCPHLPEDLDGFRDDDGCLDPDNDNDLVPDEDDLCPNESAEEFRDEDEDGCTDPD
ncbi:MAG: cell envelope biogenesis protein OmpA, partial [Myxococcales bacterium]|nr:cell envelope biogenesis protein OmpA [Myxococcales bacterium]